MRISRRCNLIIISLIAFNYTAAKQRVIAQCKNRTVCTCSTTLEVKRTYRRGRWFVLESPNFRVFCDRTDSSAEHLARHAENWRAELRDKWLGEPSAAVWKPACEVFLHSSRKSYLAAIGRGGERTVGSSVVKIGHSRIKARRIDLLDTEEGFLCAALPHELTHVVLNDKFIVSPLPRWADEGMATLADPAAKLNRHRNDLRTAYASGNALGAGALLTSSDYPSPDQMGAFYAQSVSLTEFLVEQGTPAQFVAFIERAQHRGYDSALRECYEIDGVGDLDRRWRARLTAVLASNN